MSALKQIDRQILKSLAQSDDGLLAFTIYRRFRVSVPALSAAIDRITRLGYVTFDDERLMLTEKGRSFMARTFVQGLFKGDQPWKEAPEEFSAPRLSTFDPYVPIWLNVDAEILPQQYRAYVRKLQARKQRKGGDKTG